LKFRSGFLEIAQGAIQSSTPSSQIWHNGRIAYAHSIVRPQGSGTSISCPVLRHAKLTALGVLNIT
jgi:hypothetical protein